MLKLHPINSIGMLPFLTRSKPKKLQIQRRSLENPSTSLSDPSAWFWDSVGASISGVSVNKRSAMSLPAFAAAVGRRARTIGSISCKIFEQTDKGLLPAKDHPLYNLLNRSPHPLYNRAVFMATMVTNYDTDGVAYAEIVRAGNGTGPVEALEILQKHQVKDLQRTENGYYFIVEKQTIVSGRKQTVKTAVPLSNMIWLKDLSFNGIDAIDKIAANKEVIGTGLAAHQYANKFFEGGAQIPFAVESPLEMSPAGKNRFYQEFERLFTGVKNFFKRPFILDKGMKLHSLKMSPQEAEMTATKKSVTEDTARIHDVPPHMIGAGERFTFSSIEMMQTDFVQYSLRNTLIQFQIELENKLLTASERARYRIRFNLDALLQGDIKTRTEKLINEFKWGIITKNEYREFAGYNKDDGGDIFFNPLNMFVSRKDEETLNPTVQNDEEQ